jgi:mono/diheme cytochrome c family protein
VTPLKRALTVTLAAASLLAVATGCGGGGDSSSPGGKIYKDNCATCHGAEGEGLFGPNLHGIAKKYTLDEHIDIVTNGKKGGMPPWKEKLGDEKIKEVVEYERATFK